MREQGYVDVEDILSAEVAPELADALDEGQALIIAHRAAHLHDHHLGVGGFSHAHDAFANLTRDVGDHLHRAAQEVAAPLFLDHVLEHLAGGHVALAGEVLVDEALVMAQVQVGFRAIFRHEHLAVLVGAHGAGIDVEVGIELLNGDADATALEQTPDGGHGHAFAHGGDDAAGYEDVLGNARCVRHLSTHFRGMLSLVRDALACEGRSRLRGTLSFTRDAFAAQLRPALQDCQRILADAASPPRVERRFGRRKLRAQFVRQAIQGVEAVVGRVGQAVIHRQQRFRLQFARQVRYRLHADPFRPSHRQEEHVHVAKVLDLRRGGHLPREAEMADRQSLQLEYKRRHCRLPAAVHGHALNEDTANLILARTGYEQAVVFARDDGVIAKRRVAERDNGGGELGQAKRGGGRVWVGNHRP